MYITTYIYIYICFAYLAYFEEFSASLRSGVAHPRLAATYVYIYIYTCIHTCIHTYIYIYIHTFIQRESEMYVYLSIYMYI